MSTALIVEDDRDQALLASNLVRLHKLDPVVAGDGLTGLRLAREMCPDVVLLDLMLPDTDGFDVCRALRRDDATRLTPVVMLTALGDEHNRRRGYRVGANAYLTKPYDAGDLFRAIDEARAWRKSMEADEILAEIRVELNSETAYLQEVNDFLSEINEKTPLTHEQVQHLRQAVMEIGQNAIEWGNSHRSEALVRITYRLYADRVAIVVLDEGAGFDVNNVPHAAQADDPIAHMDVRESLGLREGGFGMMISRGMLDELRYNDRGNEVTLIKRFQAPS